MKEVITTDKAPAAVGPYSQAIKSGGFLFISGQIPFDPSSGKLVQGDIKAQTKQVLENISAVVDASGMTLENVVKCSCFLKDMNHFTDFNSVYETYFKEPFPARECVEVARLPKDVLVEISAILSE